MNIAVIGAGPAGLYTAILLKLRDPNCQVVVYERSPAGTVLGWGVTLGDDTIHAIRERDAELCRAIVAEAFLWEGYVVEVNGQQAKDFDLGFGIGRQTLVDIMVRRATTLGIDVRFGAAIRKASELPDADLIVAADGVNSRLRESQAAAFGSSVHVGNNKLVWLGTTKVFKSFVIAVLPTSSGLIWLYGYGFASGMTTVVVECPPETWAGLGLDRLGRQESLALLESIFKGHLDGHELLAQGEEASGLPWMNFRSVYNEAWYVDALVLVGDAAHCTHFSIGSGTRFAVQDANELVDSLNSTTDIRSALAIYQERRKAAIARPLLEARRSAQWYENMNRYVGLSPRQFMVVMKARSSRYVHRIPPLLFYHLYRLRHGKAAKTDRGTYHALLDSYAPSAVQPAESSVARDS